jgi:DNA-binding NarL/FixJ family response regulator
MGSFGSVRRPDYIASTESDLSESRPWVLFRSLVKSSRHSRLLGLAIIAIHAECPAAKIIVLTNLEGDALAQRALKAGAQGYLLKGSMRTDLPETVRSVYKGAKAIDSDVAVRLAEHVSDERLSPREIEVLSLIAAGNSNKMISAQLGLSEETTKAHVKNIIAKLHAHDRTHAVTVALRRGIIQL